MNDQLKKLIEREKQWIELLNEEGNAIVGTLARTTHELDRVAYKKRLLEIEAELETHQQYLSYYQNNVK